jgi:transcriptional regulator with XRE-family HTH domain
VNFTEKLRRLVEDRTRSKLARRAGLSPTAISDYLVKGYIPRADNALRIAHALNISVEWLVNDEANWPPVRVTAVEVAREFLDPTEAKVA